MENKEEIIKKIERALKEVYDPEIPVNIYDLGLVYGIDIDDSYKAKIVMTLTAPNCPMVDQLLEDVDIAVNMVAEVRDVAIELTFDPPWDRSRMSEEALFELGLL